MSFKIRYDPSGDVLFLGREGIEEEMEELYPGIHVEFNAEREVIGIEVLRASHILKDIAEPLWREVEKSRLAAAERQGPARR